MCQQAFDEIRLFSEARPLVMESLHNTQSAEVARWLLDKDPNAKEIWGQCVAAVAGGQAVPCPGFQVFRRRSRCSW